MRRECVVKTIAIEPRRLICWAVFTCVLIGGDALAHGRALQPERVILSNSATATCFDSTGSKLAGSMLVRTPVLLSPDGDYQAYAESEAVAQGRFKNGDRWSEAECVNTSRLFVKGPGENTFRQVFSQQPSQYELWNDLKVIDWSPDGRHLLSDLGTGQWGSDWGWSRPLLYDASDGTLSSDQLVETAFNKTVDHDCSFVVQTLGFAPNGDVVLKMAPFFDEEGIMDPSSCVKKKGMWLLNVAAEAVTPLPNEYEVQRYGRSLAQLGK